MSGVALGLVDEVGHPVLRSHLEGIEDFDVLRLGSESDAEMLVSQGHLNEAVVLQPEEVRVLLDASCLQISQAILAAAQSGAQEEAASLKKPGESLVITRYLFGYDLEMMDTVGPAILGLVVFFTFINAAISFIRERSSWNAIEVVSPLSRVEIVFLLRAWLLTLHHSAVDHHVAGGDFCPSKFPCAATR